MMHRYLTDKPSIVSALDRPSRQAWLSNSNDWCSPPKPCRDDWMAKNTHYHPIISRRACTKRWHGTTGISVSWWLDTVYIASLYGDDWPTEPFGACYKIHLSGRCILYLSEAGLGLERLCAGCQLDFGNLLSRNNWSHLREWIRSYQLNSIGLTKPGLQCPLIPHNNMERVQEIRRPGDRREDHIS